MRIKLKDMTMAQLLRAKEKNERKRVQQENQLKNLNVKRRNLFSQWAEIVRLITLKAEIEK